MRITDLAKAVAPDAVQQIAGIRPGEKLHEVLVSSDEARNTLELPTMYVIQPNHPWWKRNETVTVGIDKAFTSDTNYNFILKGEFTW